MNAITATSTPISRIFLTTEEVEELADSSVSASVSSQGAQATVGHGSEIGTSDVSPQQPSQVFISSC